MFRDLRSKFPLLLSERSSAGHGAGLATPQLEGIGMVYQRARGPELNRRRGPQSGGTEPGLELNG